MAETHQREFIPVRIAILTVSDTRTRENDTSGDTLEARVREAGHHVSDRTIVPDDKKRIVDQLVAWIADPEIDVVISTGGTGLTGRDVTPEAFRSVFDKEIDGFSAVFHRISIGGRAFDVPFIDRDHETHSVGPTWRTRSAIA